MRPLSRIVVLGVLVSAGCVKQDTEILSRVGRNLAEKTKTSTAGLRERLPFRLTVAGEPSLADRIQQRLANDKLLAAATIAVHINGAEAELKGAVERDEQKRRAVDLAETTQGVEKVIDSLQVSEAKAGEN